MMLRRRLVTLSATAPGHLAAVVGVGLAVLGLSVAQGLLAARALTAVLAGEPWASLIPLLLWVAILIGLRSVFQLLKEVAAMNAAGILKRRLRQRIYRHLLDLGPGYLATTRAGYVQMVLVDAVEALEGYLGFYLPQVLVTLIGTPILLAFLISVDGPVGWLVAGAWSLTLLAPKLWERVLGEYGQKHWRAYGELASTFLDSLQGMTVLKAFGASGSRGRELHARALTLYRETMAQLSVSMVRSGLVGLARSLGTVLAVGFGAWRVVQGALTVPDLFLLLFLCAICFEPLAELDNHWHRGYGGLTAEPLFFELLSAQPQAPAPASPRERTILRAPQVRFEGVTFAYGEDRPALEDITFTIEAGQRVALVGRSGSGKSTVAALLLRFFDPAQGRVLLDGVDLRSLRPEDLRRAVAWVAQDPFLFAGTIEANLAFARPGADAQQIEAAARAADIHEFIVRQPAGYQTQLGDRGLTLSGGERQRLAIARAVLKDAPLLILDEATSAVDGASESTIQRVLGPIMADRTTLIIAHRLSTVRDADRILVLDRGRVVEAGRHEELVVGAGAYAGLVAAQEAMA